MVKLSWPDIVGPAGFLVHGPRLPRGAMTARLLAAIREKDGMRFYEMQKFIVELKGLDWNELVPERRWNPAKNRVEPAGERRRYRGFWCDRLHKLIHGHEVYDVKGWRHIGSVLFKCADGKYRWAWTTAAPDWRPDQTIAEDYHAV